MVVTRVVTRRDDARLAMVLSVASSSFLGLAVAEDVLHQRMLRGAPGDDLYAMVVATAITVAGLAPLLVWPREQGEPRSLELLERAVRVGKIRIEAEAVTALSVSRGNVGVSVAVAHGERGLTFFEVERAKDAARIAATLGVATPPRGRIAPKVQRRLLVGCQAVLGGLALFLGPLSFFAATSSERSSMDAKAMFGIGGVVCAVLATAVLVARRLLPDQAGARGRSSAWDAHVALHHRADEITSVDEVAPPEALEPAPTYNLERGNEAVRVWLARLDALPTAQHAYRGDALGKETLWQTLEDAGASVDARMAAARVLSRRFGEEERALVRVVGDPDVRARVEAVLENQEDAERRIVTLGPMFRAR